MKCELNDFWNVNFKWLLIDCSVLSRRCVMRVIITSSICEQRNTNRSGEILICKYYHVAHKSFNPLNSIQREHLQFYLKNLKFNFKNSLSNVKLLIAISVPEQQRKLYRHIISNSPYFVWFKLLQATLHHSVCGRLFSLLVFCKLTGLHYVWCYV